MSLGKIVPLIAIAQQRAVVKAEAELRELIDAIDAEIDALERKLGQKLEEIREIDDAMAVKMEDALRRIEQLEGGVP